MKKPQGVLRGTTLSRKSWRYSPTNDLLAVFVQLAAVRISPPTNQDRGRIRNYNQFAYRIFCNFWRSVLAYWLIDHLLHSRVQSILLRRVKIFEPCYVAYARWGFSAIFQTTLQFNACILLMQLKR